MVAWTPNVVPTIRNNKKKSPLSEQREATINDFIFLALAYGVAGHSSASPSILPTDSVLTIIAEWQSGSDES